MSMPELILGAATIWLGIGGLVAAAFLLVGADRVLDDARGVYLFRVLVAPGLALLWPIVIWRWRVRERDQIDWQTNHKPRRTAAGLLEWAMTLSLIALLVLAVTMLGEPTIPEPKALSAIGFWVGELA